MYISTFLVPFLLSSFPITTASTAQNHLQRPATFSRPSDVHSISKNPPTTSDEPSFINSTISIVSPGIHHPVQVAYSLTSSTCAPLQHEIPFIMGEIFASLRSEYPDEITFHQPKLSSEVSPSRQLGGGFVKQMYRTRYVIGLTIELSPLVPDVKSLSVSDLGIIVGLVEQSAFQLETQIRRRQPGMALGSVSVFEMEVQNVTVVAEWKFFKVVDGSGTLCEG